MTEAAVTEDRSRSTVNIEATGTLEAVLNAFKLWEGRYPAAGYGTAITYCHGLPSGQWTLRAHRYASCD